MAMLLRPPLLQSEISGFRGNSHERLAVGEVCKALPLTLQGRN